MPEDKNKIDAYLKNKKKAYNYYIPANRDAYIQYDDVRELIEAGFHKVVGIRDIDVIVKYQAQKARLAHPELYIHSICDILDQLIEKDFIDEAIKLGEFYLCKLMRSELSEKIIDCNQGVIISLLEKLYDYKMHQKIKDLNKEVLQ